MSGSILDHPLISSRYFFPCPDRIEDPLLVATPDGATLACALRRVSADARTVVHFHGNGEVTSDWLSFADWLGSELGLNVLLAEYRGYGMSTGVPELGKILEDVEQLVRATQAPPERLIFFGRSVGSIFALEAIQKFPSAAGLILESGIADPLERLLLRVEPAELGVSAQELERAVQQRLDHRAKIAAYRAPVLILHCRHDGLVDVSHAERLASWAGGPVTLEIFEHGDHNSILGANELAYKDAVRAFVTNLRG